jgi:hypothetical protein
MMNINLCHVIKIKRLFLYPDAVFMCFVRPLEYTVIIYLNILNLFVFDVHGSVHLGHLYVQLKVQLDVHVYICILCSSLFLYVHVSSAICTHPQEHNCSIQP